MEHNKHNPTPWQYELSCDDETSFATVRAPDGEFIAELRHNAEAYPTFEASTAAYEQMEANAAHIVHCVNTHDATVEALEFAVAYLVKPDHTGSIDRAFNAKAYAENDCACAQHKQYRKIFAALIAAKKGAE